MPSRPRYSYSKVQAYAVIDGRETEVVGVQVDFTLNTIPQCQLLLPVGRASGGGAATIHSQIESLTEQKPIEVWMSLQPTARSDGGIRALDIPSGTFKVFEGLTAGGGYVRTGGGAQYTISANHGLVRLNQGSALSDRSSPGNPAQYSHGNILRDSTDTGARDWTIVSRADGFITPSTLRGDVWGEALYPWLDALTEEDGLWLGETERMSEATNIQAKAGLDLLKPGGPCYVPLQIRDDIEIDIDVALSISQDVTLQTFAPAFTANQTIWDILVGNFAANYGFAIVPTAAGGLVTPYVSGYRGDGAAFQDLLAQEYDHCELNKAMPRPLRAYGILSGLATRSGLDGLPGDATSDKKMGLGGWYDTEKEGAVIVGHAPRWMAQLISPANYSPMASGGDGKAINTATSAGAGEPNDAREKSKARGEKTIKPLLNAYAKTRYAQEVLKGRYGVVSGALRFDIAPGSVVRVEGAAEQFIAADDQFGQAHFGEVLRVSIVANAESRQAGTAFHLGSVRTEKENGDDRTSVEGHPIYDRSFLGCRLVEG